MLTFDDLDKAARMIAVSVPRPARHDLYQDIMEHFCRYKPPSFTVALVWAQHARSNTWQREKRHLNAELSEYVRYRGFDPTADEAITRAELAAVPREIVRIATTYKACGKDRVRLHRWRKCQVREGE